jgi:hypothetical protein
MTNEAETLLSLIYQADGQVKVESGQLLIGPVTLAKKFSDQIRKLKPEILVSLGHCPICAGKLIVEMESRQRLSDEKGQRGVATYCPMRGHFDKWEIREGEGK